jgi:hypothetical protein
VVIQNGNTATVPPPSREDLVRLLDADIESAIETRDAGGWTQWALLGGVAALSAVALGTWETQVVVAREAALFFLLIVLMFDGVIAPVLSSRKIELDSSVTRRLMLPVFIRAERPALIATVSWALVCAVALRSAERDILPRFVLILGYAYFLFKATTAVSVFLVDLGGFPIPATLQDHKHPRLIRGIAYAFRAIPLVLLAMILPQLSIAPSGHPASSMRFGVLIAIDLLLLFQLAQTHNAHRPLIELLRQIRRRLLSNQIDERAAFEEWETITVGMTPVRFLNDDIVKSISILSTIETNEQGKAAILSDLNAKMDDFIANSQAASPDQDKRAFLEYAVRQLEVALQMRKRHNALLADARVALSRAFRKAQFVSAALSSSADDLIAPLNRVHERLLNVGNLVDQRHKLSEQIGAKIATLNPPKS